MHESIQELARYFPDRFRQRGALYFKRGDVIRLKGSGETWDATVRGSSAFYDVFVGDIFSESPDLACDCPAMRHYDICKHIWAVLLAVDERLESPPSSHSRQHPWQQLVEASQNPETSVRRPTQSSKLRLLYVLGISEEPWIAKYELKVLARELGKKGTWNKRREYRPSDFDRASDQDRKVLTLLNGGTVWGTQRQWRTHSGSFDMDIPELEAIFDELVKTGRMWFDEDQIDTSPPLKFDSAGAFTLRITLSRDTLPPFQTHFVRNEEVIPIAKVTTHLPNGHFLAEDDQLVREYTPKVAELSVDKLIQTKGIDLQPGEVDDCFVALQNTPLATAVVPPAGWTIRPAGENGPQPILSISDRSGNLLQGTISYDYGVEIADPKELKSLVNVESRTITPRDFEKETTLLQDISNLKSVEETSSAHEVWVQATRLPKLVEEFHDKGWVVRAGGVLQRASTGSQAKVSSGQDWFDLHGGIAFGSQVVPFPQLLAALKDGAKTVRLDDGSEGVLPEAWLKRQGLLELAEETDEDQLRFTSSQGLLLDLLLDEAPQADLDAKFTRWRQELRSFKGAKPANEPRGFTGELREYQKEGVGWMKFLRQFGFGGCLADDMGLGKTVQVLADVQTRKISKKTKGPTLVVAPRSVVHNWITEAKRFAPKLKIVDYSLADRSDHLDSIPKSDLVVTTYGIIRRDITHLREIDFRCVVLDEAQAIKNEKSQTARACLLLQATERLALSGTPIENRIEELWSIFEFLNPGMLGSVKKFAELSGDDPETRAKLGRALAPFIMRRTKEEVATDLPEKSELILECDLGPKQRKLYDELRRHYRASLDKTIETLGFQKSKFQVLEALLRLRQAACHPGLIDEKRSDEAAAKLDLLMDRLEEVVAEGHKALVFSQFTKHLALVRKRLEAANLDFEYLDGATRKRGEKIDRFQTDPNCCVFLISLKAGGTGLNLTAADYVFILDPWWNPAAEAQAIDRTHRIGQTRQVFAYRLIARDTIEEKIVAMQDEKRELARSILDGTTKTLKDLTASDLSFLLE